MEQPGDRRREPVRARLLSDRGRFGALEELPRQGQGDSAFRDDPAGFTVAISPRGRVFVAWATILYGLGDEADLGWRVYTAVRPLRSGFTPARVLSPNSAIDSEGIAQIDAAFTSDERALVAWTDGRTDNAHVHAAVFRGVAPVAQRQLTRGKEDAQVADVAAGPRGRAVVVWATQNTQSDFRSWEPRLLRASLVHGERFGAAKPVSPAGVRGSLAFPRVAFDRARGRAVAIWIRFAPGDSPATAVETASRPF